LRTPRATALRLDEGALAVGTQSMLKVALDFLGSGGR